MPRAIQLKSQFRLVPAVLFAGLLGALAAGCGGGGGGGGPPVPGGDPSVAAKTTPLPSGDPDCPYGGILVETGIDENGNGILDDAEVDASEKVCNGEPGVGGSDGRNALIETDPEPVGANCPYGGLRIDVGIDDDGDGALAQDEVTRTDFVCNYSGGNFGWQVAVPIEFRRNDDATNPQLAMAANGNAVAVWQQSDGTRDNIWANHYVPGTGWTGPLLLETDDSGSAEHPQVAVDANGNAVAVWRQLSSSTYNIWANYYQQGVGWTGAVLIETVDSGSATNLHVAMDASGNAVAVWAQSDGTRQDIWANRYSTVDGWGQARKIEADDAGDALSPRVAMDADGNAIAVWEQWNGSRYDITANRYVTGIGWGAVERIETDDTGNSMDPQVAVDGDGNAVAVWRQSDGTSTNLVANRFTVGTGWGTAEPIETETGEVRFPRVAMDADGNAVAVWRQLSNSAQNTWANYYQQGVGWTGAVLIETDSAGMVDTPQVAMSANGTAVAVWGQDDGFFRYNIWANRFVPGVGWGLATSIDTRNYSDAGTGAHSPQVAMDASGNAIAVWQQYDEIPGSVFIDIWANRWQAP